MDNNNLNNEQPTLVPNNSNTSNDKFMIKNSITTVMPPVDPNQPAVQPMPETTTTPAVPVVDPTVVSNTSTEQAIPQVNIPNVKSTDNNAMVNEKLKKVEINYTPPSKAKVFLLVVFFLLLLGFIIFLPDINSLVGKYINGGEVEEEIITTGKLKCSLSTNTTNLDKEYNYVFRFTDNKLEKTEFNIVTKGDVTLDEETLNELNKKCVLLKDSAKGLNGVTIQCNYSDGKLEEIQSFDLANVDDKELDAAYTEAGGNKPTYQYGQDIDQIEKTMNASNHKCRRER